MTNSDTINTSHRLVITQSLPYPSMAHPAIINMADGCQKIITISQLSHHVKLYMNLDGWPAVTRLCNCKQGLDQQSLFLMVCDDRQITGVRCHDGLVSFCAPGSHWQVAKSWFRRTGYRHNCSQSDRFQELWQQVSAFTNCAAALIVHSCQYQRLHNGCWTDMPTVWLTSQQWQDG